MKEAIGVFILAALLLLVAMQFVVSYPFIAAVVLAIAFAALLIGALILQDYFRIHR